MSLWHRLVMGSKNPNVHVPRVIDIPMLKAVGGWDKWKNGKMRWIEPNCMVVGMRVTST